MGGAPSRLSEDEGRRWALQYKITIIWTPDCDFPEGMLHFLQDSLATSPSNIVHALIKDDLSALTLIEYVMDYIRFTFIEPSDFAHIDLEKMTAMHKGIATVDDMFRSTLLYDEEQSRRVEAAYQDIFSAMKESARLQTYGKARGEEGSLDFSAWQPAFNLKNYFSSDTEKNFMTRLRHLYAMSRTLAAGEIFRRLTDICQSVNPEQIMLSDVSSNTAIRSVYAILARAIDKLCSRRDITERRFDILKSYFDKWVKSPTRGNKIANSAFCLFIRKQRSNFLNELLSKARATCQLGFKKLKPVKVEQPNLLQALSPLWKKLQSIGSLPELLKLSGQQSCAICQEDDIQPINFAILDKCLHVYCVGCIEAWFKKSNICPYCRVRTTNWTTRDYFLAFREQLPTAARTEQPDISGTA